MCVCVSFSKTEGGGLLLAKIKNILGNELTLKALIQSLRLLFRDIAILGCNLNGTLSG